MFFTVCNNLQWFPTAFGILLLGSYPDWDPIHVLNRSSYSFSIPCQLTGAGYTVNWFLQPLIGRCQSLPSWPLSHCTCVTLYVLPHQVSTLEGVLEVRNEHFWTVGFGSLVRHHGFVTVVLIVPSRLPVLCTTLCFLCRLPPPDARNTKRTPLTLII